MRDPEQDKIHLQVPVKITYQALEALLRKQLVGENIATEDNGETKKYATILDVHLAKSLKEGFDLAVDVDFKTLTTFFRNKEGSILLDASLQFDQETQQLSVKDYEFDVESGSWLLNNSLETLVRTFFRKKIQEKMKFDFRPMIEEQMGKINKTLENTLQPKEGIAISGSISKFRIVQILPRENLMLAVVIVEGRAMVEVESIEF